jgi:hypothetical protein
VEIGNITLADDLLFLGCSFILDMQKEYECKEEDIYHLLI